MLNPQEMIDEAAIPPTGPSDETIKKVKALCVLFPDLTPQPSCAHRPPQAVSLSSICSLSVYDLPPFLLRSAVKANNKRLDDKKRESMRKKERNNKNWD